MLTKLQLSGTSRSRYCALPLLSRSPRAARSCESSEDPLTRRQSRPGPLRSGELPRTLKAHDTFLLRVRTSCPSASGW